MLLFVFCLRISTETSLFEGEPQKKHPRAFASKRHVKIFFSLFVFLREKKKSQTTTRVYLYREVERRILQTDARFSGGYGVTGTATHSR